MKCNIVFFIRIYVQSETQSTRAEAVSGTAYSVNAISRVSLTRARSCHLNIFTANDSSHHRLSYFATEACAGSKTDPRPLVGAAAVFVLIVHTRTHFVTHPTSGLRPRPRRLGTRRWIMYVFVRVYR